MYFAYQTQQRDLYPKVCQIPRQEHFFVHLRLKTSSSLFLTPRPTPTALSSSVGMPKGHSCSRKSAELICRLSCSLPLQVRFFWRGHACPSMLTTSAVQFHKTKSCLCRFLPCPIAHGVGITTFEEVYGAAALCEGFGGVRLITAAPEIEGVIPAMKELTRRGITCSIGHRCMRFLPCIFTILYA